MNRSEQKKRAIINAAKTEFIENGFAAANMNNVSAAAEVSKRTLYRHFESKELLFEAVLSIVQEEIERKGDYPYHPDQTLEAQLAEITQREIEVLYQNYGIAFSRTIVMEFFRQPELAKSVSQRLYRTRAVNGWFEKAIADGRLVADEAQTITSVYISLFQGLMFWPQVLDLNEKPEGAELASKIDTIVSTVIKAFSPNH
ncbi:TetR/AcrR family transcriptional regulator [Vibrio intestinalis]|uniref:TetR/AcrR family transcriptional regulator n=1 Tax=Vibrio intestinalis TaxID=2933291 RepID=UPI0021A58D7D|nr:TetR/AcrR family transcriptional regulator [Vibrio intestinalis]